jgi:hypothetical protein
MTTFTKRKFLKLHTGIRHIAQNGEPQPFTVIIVSFARIDGLQHGLQNVWPQMDVTGATKISTACVRFAVNGRYDR